MIYMFILYIYTGLYTVYTGIYIYIYIYILVYTVGHEITIFIWKEDISNDCTIMKDDLSERRVLTACKLTGVLTARRCNVLN